MTSSIDIRRQLIAASLAIIAASAASLPAHAQQGATCVTNNLSQTGAIAQMSGVNNCGLEVRFNLCTVSAAAPVPQRFSKVLKPGEAWSFSTAAVPNVKPMMTSAYCRMGPGAIPAGCEAQCPSPAALTGTNWMRKPSGEDILRFYPERASRMEVNGRATLECTFAETGLLTACAVGKEEPSGMGFGDAALKMSRLFRSAPVSADGKPVAGQHVSVPITFRVN